MWSGLLALLQIVRPHNMIAAAMGVLAGDYVAAGTFTAGVWPVAVVAALATGAGNVINDYYDFAIDQVNKPRRPLPSGRLSPGAALVWYVLLVLATTAIAVTLPRALLVLVIGWQVALFLYAKLLKHNWVAGNLTVSLVSASAFLAGGLAADWPDAGLVPMAIAFLFVMCREVVKDGEDVEGDSRAGVRTLAVVRGPARAGVVAACAMLALAALLPVPAVAEYYNARYFLAMELLVSPVLVGGALAVAHHPERHVFRRVSHALKLAMFAGIVAIALGV